MKSNKIIFPLFFTLIAFLTFRSAHADICASGAGTSEWNGTYVGPGTQGEFVRDGSHVLFASGNDWFFSSAVFAFPSAYRSVDTGTSPVGLTFIVETGASSPGPSIVQGACVTPTPTPTPTTTATATLTPTSTLNPLVTPTSTPVASPSALPTITPSAIPTATATPLPSSDPLLPLTVCVSTQSKSQRVRSQTGTYTADAEFTYSAPGKTLKIYPSSPMRFSWIVNLDSSNLSAYQKFSDSPVGTYGKGYFIVAEGRCVSDQPPVTSTDKVQGQISPGDGVSNCLTEASCAGSASITDSSQGGSAGPNKILKDDPLILQTVPLKSDGSYEFTDISPGTYTIKFFGDGLSFSPDTVQVTVVAGTEATAPTAPSNVISYKDDGCTSKNKSSALVAANQSALAIDSFINDQLGILTAQATAELSKPKAAQFIASLDVSRNKASELVSKIITDNNLTPLIERLKCPVNNQCISQKFQSNKKVATKNTTALNRIAIKLLARSSERFKSKANLKRVLKGTASLNKLLKKAHSSISKLSSKSQICPVVGQPLLFR